MKKKKFYLSNYYLLALLFCIGLCGFVFQACEKEKIQNNDELNIPEGYQMVGKLHNQGLDHVFKIMKENIIEAGEESGFKTAIDIDYMSVIKEASLDFCKKNEFLKVNYSECENSIEEYFSEMDNNSNSLKSKEIENLTIEQQKLIRRIDNAVNNAVLNNNISELRKQISNINSEAKEKCSAEEAAAIYCASSTAFFSYEYWTKYQDKWYFAAHFSEIAEQYRAAHPEYALVSFKSIDGDGFWSDIYEWFGNRIDDVIEWWNNSGKLIIAADVTGAVGGFLGGIVKGVGVGTVLAPGAGTAVGALAGGGIGAVTVGLTTSASACIADLLIN
ncbi:hypothetical protein ACFLSY_11730 [Bacteroidota bacterium]